MKTNVQYNNNSSYMSGAVVIGIMVVASAMMFGCASFERVKDPVTGQIEPSQAETVVASAMKANAVSAPVNPYAGLITTLGEVAGAFLAGYGGAHVRIKRQEPIDAD